MINLKLQTKKCSKFTCLPGFYRDRRGVTVRSFQLVDTLGKRKNSKIIICQNSTNIKLSNDALFFFMAYSKATREEFFPKDKPRRSIVQHNSIRNFTGLGEHVLQSLLFAFCFFGLRSTAWYDSS